MREFRYSEVRTRVDLTQLLRCQSVYKFTSEAEPVVFTRLLTFLDSKLMLCLSKTTCLFRTRTDHWRSGRLASSEVLFWVRWGVILSEVGRAVAHHSSELGSDAESPSPSQTYWTRIHLLTRFSKGFVNTLVVQTHISGKIWSAGILPRRANCDGLTSASSFIRLSKTLIKKIKVIWTVNWVHM